MADKKKNPVVRRFIARLFGAVLPADVKETPEKLGLLDLATMSEIVPDLLERGDKTDAEGLKELGKAAAMTNQANSLLKTAEGWQERGERKVGAARKLRQVLDTK